jgi:hypothetical protein
VARIGGATDASGATLTLKLGAAVRNDKLEKK